VLIKYHPTKVPIAKLTSLLPFFKKLEKEAEAYSEKNKVRVSGTVELSKPDSKVKVYKVETNEELVIARDTYRLTK